MTDDGDGADETDRTDDAERTGGEHASPTGSTLSTDGAYALLWGVVSLVAAALSFDGSVGAVTGLAGFAGLVGMYATARDLLRGHPPSGLEYLWIGTPALLAAGIAALDGHVLTAGGLGVVALATLIEGYGWFGAGTEEVSDGEGRGEENKNENGNGNQNGDENGNGGR